jgi:hypothetical protein
MSFRVGEDVYVMSRLDTGEVEQVKSPLYDVNRDSDGTTGQHHEADLRGLPFRGRIHKEGFYIAVEATSAGGQRNATHRMYSSTGSRIR